MSLTVVRDELLKRLDAVVSAFGSEGYKIGLYQNNWTPTKTSVITDVTPATFSGYAGLVAISSWSAATWIDPRAVANHSAITWTHNGGPITNNIYGYYVVDGSGNLAWAERAAAAPVAMDAVGKTYQVTPQYTRRSEYS